MPFVVADTETLTSDGVITPEAAREIEARGRAAMVDLAVNAVLCFGILAATGGLIFWLANAVAVALVGALFLAGGLVALARLGDGLRMFGNAAALIGAGLLIGGAALELMNKHEDIAGWVMVPGGALVAAIAGRALLQGGLTTRFVQGAILLMGVALHLGGLGFLLLQAEISGWPKPLFYLYAAGLIAGSGGLTNVRLVTALAIVPYAQLLDTGTAYFHAAYVFYSPESTLTIATMVLLMGGLWIWQKGRAERAARHGRILMVLAFVVANLCALVGSLWGDVVGETVWGPGTWRSADFEDWDAFTAARETFRATALHISEEVYSIAWGLVLAALLFVMARLGQRGLFNTAMTFAAIHAYTQLFETFGDEPLAYVIGGLAAIPLAWGMWQLNKRWSARDEAPPPEEETGS